MLQLALLLSPIVGRVVQSQIKVNLEKVEF